MEHANSPPTDLRIDGIKTIRTLSR